MTYFQVDSHYRNLELENIFAEACKMDLISVCSRQRKEALTYWLQCLYLEEVQ